ncbi:uncharacterized protein LOC133528686 [Cydia pomonella]|uniref:uncharacterized protein LOC133528686 n=1 Tax=Cydia pomonella TaxID=82600 RepID=UPI002ADD8343|nr:uncharacterized protein LOC133528686 [Cydia pomonella]
MNSVLILLSILITLSQTKDHIDNDLYLRTGEKAAALLKSYGDPNLISKYLQNRSVRDDFDNLIASKKANTVKRVRDSIERLNDENLMNNVATKSNLRIGYQLDPILNKVRRQGNEDDSLSDSGSSSREFRDWKEEWNEMWNKMKLETKNFTTRLEGDVVNMAAARPWGVPCGDPSRHDMPWGTCVLPAECNAEYRIFKGDYFCGRTQFICCSLNFHTYDLYQGLSVSLDESSMEIDSAVERERAKKKTSKERQKRTDRRRKRRKRLREERKRKIRRAIARIIKEVRRILDKAYKNGSKIRKRKTNTMKKFIKFLKRQYKLDRESAKDIHEMQMLEVDQEFMDRLNQIKELNSEFMTNDTFRNIVVNKTLTLRGAKMLAEAYPELQGFLPKGFVKGDFTRQRNARRSGGSIHQRGRVRPRGGPRGGIVRPPNRRNRRKYLDYDIEFGLLYS